VATLEAGVVVDAHPGEHGDLLAPRRPCTRRLAPYEISPACCGLTRARRLARKSWTFLR
jgi:hypothetical protein